MQQLLVVLIVLSAAGFVGRRVWRAIAAARAPKGNGCDTGCGCAPGSTTSLT
jgi:FeoB-associated Cys-rich membrane protein